MLTLSKIFDFWLFLMKRDRVNPIENVFFFKIVRGQGACPLTLGVAPRGHDP